MKEQPRMKVMFLCTGNSCRSQMAEGFLRELSGGSIEVHSAGLFPAGIHPRAALVMEEEGIDISGQASKAIDENILRQMDFVITLCGNAEAYCPAPPPGVRRLHWPIEDPVGRPGSEEEKNAAFRKTREEIRKRVNDFLKKEVIFNVLRKEKL